YIGIPYGGFPKELQEVILKDRKPLSVRAGELLEPVNFNQLKEELFAEMKAKPTEYDVLGYALYPKVFLDYVKSHHRYGDVSCIDTPTFFYGMRIGEELEIEIEKGKTLFVKLVSVGQVQRDGTRIVYFELNGQPREVT